MELLSPIAAIVYHLLNLYLLVLLVRVVLDWVQVFARQWRPTGAVLLVANFVYALTDPPLRRIRRAVPMLRLGALGLDLSFLVLVLGIIIFQRLVALLI
ncbi:YggT family protein [Actinomyces slackii]|uniref:YGGT family n=1 Tax=Actinomyces slackii TaxID=52774 RepID=A0A3S4SQQ6_9ACTO|nr:YggT family protein [Actinomyces slackii]VEG75527.1 YGGT family [Actinomyces slackii]